MLDLVFNIHSLYKLKCCAIRGCCCCWAVLGLYLLRIVRLPRPVCGGWLHSSQSRSDLHQPIGCSGTMGQGWTNNTSSNIFCNCSSLEGSKLAKNNPYAIEQLRVCHLFVNCYTSLNGNKAGSDNTFGVSPHTLEKYLAL